MAGCVDAPLARGMCRHHYRASLAGRETRRKARPSESATERMERWIERDPNTGCWLWSGAVASRYGRMAYRGNQHAAHRLSFEVHVRPLGEGEVVCHRCDTPLCVNPLHLWAGTQRDNMRDMIEKGRDRPRGVTRNRGTA